MAKFHRNETTLFTSISQLEFAIFELQMQVKEVLQGTEHSLTQDYL
jgi:hypothetical protein